MRSLIIACVFLWFPLCGTGQSVQDVFEIKFSDNSTQYRAALVLFEDGSGAMRVKFQDEGTKVVEQSISTDSTRTEVEISGSNPVYPGTSIEFPSYKPNTFSLSKDENGDYSTITSSNSETSDATIQKIEGEREIEYFLFFFNWKLGPQRNPAL